MKELLKNKVASNAIWIIVGRVVQSILALIVSMLTARYLGPSNFGLLNYAASIVAFALPIMNLGLSNILVQETTNYPEEEGKIYGTSIILSFVSSLVCMMGVTLYTFVVDAGEMVTHYVVMLYSLMLVFQAFELIQYWFQAKLLSKYMSISYLVTYVIVSVYKIILLAKGANIYFFAVTNSLDALLIAIMLLVLYRKLGGKKFAFSGELAKRMVGKSKHYIVSGLMVTIFAQTDRIMLKLMMDETSVGYYSAAVTCAGMTAFVFAAIIDSMRPSIFTHKKNGESAAYERGIARTYCIIIYLALLQSLAMTILAKIIILVLYGRDYFPAISALRIVVWYTTFSYMGSVRNVWILGENKQKYLWILNTGGALMNVVLNAALIPFMGINGAALASLLTQIFTNIIMNVVVWPLKYNNHLIWKGLNPNLVIGLFKNR